LAGHLLPPPDNHVHVLGIQLQTAAHAARQLGG
jgi:hypothetical protein